LEQILIGGGIHSKENKMPFLFIAISGSLVGIGLGLLWVVLFEKK
jgi:hypothetical protein